MPVQLDHELGIKQVTEKIAKTENPRHRQMLEVVREHLVAENDSDIERVMATLTENPAYHTREPGGDNGPKGRDGVRAYYEGFFAIKATSSSAISNTSRSAMTASSPKRSCG